MSLKNSLSSMSLTPFKQDIDELISEFAQSEFTRFSEMKKVWSSRGFSYIFDAMPPTKLGLFMQSLYAHSTGYIVNDTASLSQRLGGLYCLYCLHETQPFKPPFRIYISLGEFKKLKNFVFEAKDHGIKDVRVLATAMLDKNMFLFGAVDMNESSSTQIVDQLTKLQESRVQHAYQRLFPDNHLVQFLHMDLGSEFDLDTLRKMSTEYAEAKKLAIQEASTAVSIEDIQHISEDKEFIGDTVENIKGNWDIQKEVFCQQTGLKQNPTHGQEKELEHQNHEQQNEDDDNNDDFSRELELQLYEEEPQEPSQEGGEFIYHESKKHSF